MYNTDFIICHGNFYKKCALGLIIRLNFLSEIIQFSNNDLCVFLQNMSNSCSFQARAFMLEKEIMGRHF